MSQIWKIGAMKQVMVCNPDIFDYLIDDNTVLEQEPMRILAEKGELKGF